MNNFSIRNEKLCYAIRLSTKTISSKIFFGQIDYFMQLSRSICSRLPLNFNHQYLNYQEIISSLSID